MTKKPKKPLDEIKSKIFSRGLALAKTSLKTGSKIAAHSISTLLSDDQIKKEKWEKLILRQTEIWTEQLGELKGSLMKAGQLLSIYGEFFLPQEANEILKKLQQDSQPVRWEKMKAILNKELGPEKLNQLKIHHEAIGTASLGQVHQAENRSTGDLLAMKIQYPGVEAAIDSDLKALKNLLSLAKILPENLRTDYLFKEVKAMLQQETKYDLEAIETQDYRNRLKDFPEFVVPQVYPEFSTSKVLTTSFEMGLRADDSLIQSLSQERRNRLGLMFLELYFLELFQWGVVQTDPHLGNYKIRLKSDGQDQLVLLDFGAMRKYSPEFLSSYHRMIRAGLQNDRSELESAAKDLKFLHESDNPRLKDLFIEFCLMTMEPFRGGDFDWKNTDLPKRASQKVFQIIQEFHFRPPPSEIIFLNRKTGGVFIFLSVLGAKINARPLLEKYLT
ncbi:MAG: ABC transporter [Oligoflexia bacterium]|nr:MAG: ABC transporter [Oligoflexia bacterium]